MKDMVSTARSSGEQPKWIVGTIWEEMMAHWSTEKQVEKSATTSAARILDRKGLGPHKHISRKSYYRQIEREIVIKLERPVSFGELFIRAHSKKDGSFVDMKAQQAVEAYMKNKQAKLAKLEIENTECSDGRHHVLSIESENEIFVQSIIRSGRGDLFGLGNLKEQLKGKHQWSGTTSSVSQIHEQLHEAQRRLEDQAALIANQEEENARIAADFALFKNFLATDDRYIAFVSNASTTPEHASNPS